jgi:hypothetical protein
MIQTDSGTSRRLDAAVNRSERRVLPPAQEKPLCTSGRAFIRSFSYSKRVVGEDPFYTHNQVVGENRRL